MTRTYKKLTYLYTPQIFVIFYLIETWWEIEMKLLFY